MSAAPRRIALVLLAFALQGVASASQIVFVGSFATDDQVQLFLISVYSPSSVMFRTWSFAGGTNAQGAVIPGGSFAPVLSLFESRPGAQGLLIASDHDGYLAGACTRATDPASGFAWDACITADLSAGDYVLALTEDDNLPFGPTLADGFARTGQGNFTGPSVFGAAGEGWSFIRVDGSQRTPAWAVDIAGVGPTSAREVGAIPEPGPLILLLSGIVGLAELARRLNSHPQLTR